MDRKVIMVEREGKTWGSREGDSRFDDEETRELWVYQLLHEATEGRYHDFSSEWYQEYELDPEIYKIWYRQQFFIDGEDASEYIRSLGREYFRYVHCNVYSDMGYNLGLKLGYKYYKKLKDADFCSSIAAKLGFWRGYLDGMDCGMKEGTEALDIMGLKRVDEDY